MRTGRTLPATAPTPSKAALSESGGLVAQDLRLVAEYYVQMDSRARLRQRLRQLIEEHARLLEVAFERTPLWRGLVLDAKRKCGKPTCRCTRGELHVSPILSDRSGEKQRSLAVKGPDLLLFRKLTEAYREVRAHRVRLVRVQREILGIFDSLEAARRREGERRHARRLSPPP